MAALFLMAAALVVQAPAGFDVAPSGIEHVEVAYQELTNGQPQAAIARIKANGDVAKNDPSALINLAAAHAMLGQKDTAAAYYRAAIASAERYDMQLADGSWMDSRRLARLGARKLAKGETLALR